MMATNTIKFKSDTKHLKETRVYVRGIARECGFSREEVHNVVLAVDEACANIIRHAYSGDTSKDIIITCDIQEDKLIITMQDFGKKPDLNRIKNPPREKLRRGGYGTVFMRELMDEVVYDLTPEQGTILRMVKYKKPETSNQ